MEHIGQAALIIFHNQRRGGTGTVEGVEFRLRKV
jgi:hypothetical protein